MKKKARMPAFLMDYSSVWNPLIKAFLSSLMITDDNNHSLDTQPVIGLHIENMTPMIDKDRLLEYGGKEVALKKNEILFHAGTSALYYYQLQEGAVKMITYSKDGQEFIQGIFSPGDSFGEPPLFCDFSYPSTAISIEDAIVVRLSKENFFKLLKENFEIHLKFDQVLCNRLKYKSMILSDISFHDPEHRIMSLLKHLKGNTSTSDHSGGLVRGTKPYVVPFTRQQLADMSGLRVETVIRTVKKMEEKGKLEIVGRKITI